MKIKGKGTLTQTSKETWVGRFSLGEDPLHPGKYLYSPKRTFHCRSEWEARKAMENYRTELEEFGIPERNLLFLDKYADKWLSDREGSYKSPRTAEREKLDIKHIKELFPKARMKSLTPLAIKTAYKEARERGRFDKEIYQINKRLRQILNTAVEDGIIGKNPANKVIIPKPEPEPKDYLDPKRLALFNQLLLSQPWSGEVVGAKILLHTGIRPGEAYALRWHDFDACACRLFIDHQFSNDMQLRKPKSKASRDWVAIDSTLWAFLITWKQVQAEYLLKIGGEQIKTTPIVSNIKGKHFDPTNYGRWFRNFCADNGFGSFSVVTKTFIRNGKTFYRGKGYVGLCPNMFRDIQATMLVGHVNVDPRTLQARMRHSDPSISLRFYTHPVLDNEFKAAEAFANILNVTS